MSLLQILLRKTIIILIIFLSLLTPAVLRAQSNQSAGINVGYRLLLESALSDAKTGTLKYIVWTEEDRFLPQIESELLATGLNWQKEIQSNSYGQKAYKLSTTFIILKEEERKAMVDYLKLSELLKKYQAQVFLEEDIEALINVENYLELNNSRLLQEIKIDGLISVAGYRPDLPGTVQAGKDLVNIQILTKENSGTLTAKTVLALPALMEEF